jgi:hypothetical protein
VAVLTFDRIDVSPTRVEAVVRVSEPGLARTSAVSGVAERALALLPGLRRHSCENGSAHGIAAELADTETPHLLEHIAFELMALSGSPRTLKGETAWDFSADGAGVYRVRLAYDVDLVALGALKAGAGIVEWLLAETDGGGRGASAEPNVAEIVSALEALR